MKSKTLFSFMIALAIISVSSNTSDASVNVLGISTISQEDKEGIYKDPVVIKTTTAFSQKEVYDLISIPYETTYQDNKEVEYGIEEVIQEGKDGTVTNTYLLTYWEDIEIDKQLLSTEKKDPTTEIIDKGTKIVWRLKDTPDMGRVKYWYKLEVYATKYDANCFGCTGRTYSGTEVVKGVCATDPRVIPLGTNMYVEGYGFCRAEDIGGAIKGNKIDLGYKDVTKGEWRTGYTTVYLLTNAPE